MDNCTYLKILWPLPLMLNFRLGIFHSKTILYSFWARENGLKADKSCKMFSHLNICLHNHFFICLHIVYDTFILHLVHHTLSWMSG